MSSSTTFAAAAAESAISSSGARSKPSSAEKKQKKKSKGKGGEQASKRLQSELMQLMMSGDSSATAFPEGDNLFHWVGKIKGSKDTVYEGLTYKLSLKFPTDYPYSAPTIKFVTPCFHPNVDNYGNICLDILKEQWSAAYSISTILVSLRSLLGEPNNDSPLNPFAASLWENQRDYKSVLIEKYELAKAGKEVILDKR